MVKKIHTDQIMHYFLFIALPLNLKLTDPRPGLRNRFPEDRV